MSLQTKPRHSNLEISERTVAIDPKVTKSAVSENESTRKKRHRSVASAIAQQFVCPISQDIIVDPVIGEDGNTYERADIELWLSSNSTSPMDPSCTMSVASLRPNRAVREAIQTLVESGEMDEDLNAAYQNKKQTMDLKRANELFTAGKVLDAAKLGLPKAQGVMANRYYHGTHGVVKDVGQSIVWATKAAQGGDRHGQRWIGWAHHFGQGVDLNWVEALRWYELASAQGDVTSARSIANIYQCGNPQVPLNLQKAFTWFQTASEGGDTVATLVVAKHYYDGTGVAKDFEAARKYYNLASLSGNVLAQARLGAMMVRGEGGLKDFSGGMGKLQQAAEEGCMDARALLSELCQSCARLL